MESGVLKVCNPEYLPNALLTKPLASQTPTKSTPGCAFKMAQWDSPIFPAPTKPILVIQSPPSGRLIEFSCEVSSGTYVRALARDLGAGLGCGAHLHSLRRQTVGEFDVARAESLDTVGAATTLRPALEAVSHLPAIEIEPDVQQKVWHGQPIPWSGSVVGPVALVADNRLLAVAEPDNGVLKPKVVLAG